MKDKFFKYALVVVFSAMTYFAIAAYEQKDACAEGECLEIVSVAMEFVGAIAAIMDGDISGLSALSFVGQYIDNIKKMAESYIDFYTDALETEAEETKEMMQKIARQKRAADIAVAGQWGSIYEAGAMIKKTTRYQRSQTDTLTRYPAPSNQVCRQTSYSVRENQVQNYTEFEQSVSLEANRRRSGGVRGVQDPYNSTQGSTQSPIAHGPIVYGAMMRNATKFYCFDDEHNRNTRWNGYAGACYLRGGSDGSYANESDKAPNGSYISYLTGDMPMGYFGPNSEIPYMKQLILPPPLLETMPKAIVDSEDVQMSYLSLTTSLAQTQLNEIVVDYLTAQRSGFVMSDQQWSTHSGNGVDPLIQPGYSGVIHPCKRALDMVRQTYTEVYGHALLGSNEENNTTSDECPSAQTMEHAAMLSISSASGIGSILAQEEPNMKQAELFIYILRHKLDFNNFQKEQLLTLQLVVDKLNKKSNPQAPIDSEAR